MRERSIAPLARRCSAAGGIDGHYITGKCAEYPAATVSHRRIMERVTVFSDSGLEECTTSYSSDPVS